MRSESQSYLSEQSPLSFNLSNTALAALNVLLTAHNSPTVSKVPETAESRIRVISSIPEKSNGPDSITANAAAVWSRSFWLSSLLLPIGIFAFRVIDWPIEVEVKGVSWLQRELHSRILRVSSWSEWAGEVSFGECESKGFVRALVEKGGLVVKKRIGDFLMDMKWLESSINGRFLRERRKGIGCLASVYPFHFQLRNYWN